MTLPLLIPIIASGRSQYRQQIEADIKPFEGILLGIFFMTAGANLDPGLCLAEWPTLVSGILAFLGAKIGILFAAGFDTDNITVRLEAMLDMTDGQFIPDEASELLRRSTEEDMDVDDKLIEMIRDKVCGSQHRPLPLS